MGINGDDPNLVARAAKAEVERIRAAVGYDRRGDRITTDRYIAALEVAISAHYEQHLRQLDQLTEAEEAADTGEAGAGVIYWLTLAVVVVVVVAWTSFLIWLVVVLWRAILG